MTNRDFKKQAAEKVANRIKQTGKNAMWDYRFNTIIGTIFSNRFKHK